MYYRDHSPPHFHAIYGEYEILVKLEDYSVVQGEMPNRALKLIKEWASMHGSELKLAWEAASNLRPPESIAPLD